MTGRQSDRTNPSRDPDSAFLPKADTEKPAPVLSAESITGCGDEPITSDAVWQPNTDWFWPLCFPLGEPLLQQEAQMPFFGLWLSVYLH